MALSVNVLVPAFLLLFFVQGARSEKCTPASIEVLQTSNGEKAGVDPVFEVMVRNRCECAVRGVILGSKGFSSSLPVDPKLFRKEGNGYLVGDGSLIQSGAVVQFRYAWDRAFEIGPLAVQEDCSGLHEFTV
ncbi:uncharacterized protein LOC101783078 [Setaria italica]|nr:uncharacterized protein LOC101783078 [Setaria italica]XP_034569884.1 uncharacterized protein LOC117834402 [Setaria viridis]